MTFSFFGIDAQPNIRCSAARGACTAHPLLPAQTPTQAQSRKDV